MVAFISFIHVVMSLILIVIVLLQTGKGTDLASAFGGGGSQTLFGSHGAASFLNKLTTVAAIMYMVTSLSLAILSAAPEKSMMENVEVTPEQTETTTVPGSSETTNLPSEQEAVPSETTTTGQVDESETSSLPADSDVSPAVDTSESAPVTETQPGGDDSVSPAIEPAEQGENPENSDS